MPPLIQFRNVSKSFRSGIGKKQKSAVEDFSVTIPGDPPSITALVGESGSGKTTVARLFLGLLPPTSGEVLYNGKSLQGLNAAERHRFRRDVQIVFQNPFEVYNPFYTVDHLLTVPIVKFHLASSRQRRNELIEKALTAVGLDPGELLGRYPHQLSGGQGQRLSIARVLLIHPRLIIADEPVSMVDASLRASILSNLRQLHSEFGISLFYITHDLATAFQVSRNMVVMYRGLAVEAGDIRMLVQSPKHPYTQLLIDSIPRPDPNQPWGGQQDSSSSTIPGETVRRGCPFSDRCPHVTKDCLLTSPPLFRTSQHQAAACILYRDSPIVENRNLDTVLVRHE